MKLAVFLFFLLTVISFPREVSAQGIFTIGGKQQIQITGLGNVPLLSGTFKQDNYYERNGEIRGRRDLLDVGANFRYSIKASKNLRLGVDFIYRHMQVSTDRTYRSDFRNSILGVSFQFLTKYRVQSIAVPHMTIQPVIIFSSPGSINGSGIEHTFGLGVTSFKPRKKAYAYSLSDFPEDESTWTKADYFYLDHNWPRTYAGTVQYGIALSVPLDDHFLFKIGSVVLLTVYIKPDFDNVEDSEIGLFDYESIFFNTQQENFITWSLQSGIVYRF